MINLFRCQENNFGDNLSTYLTHKVSGMEVNNVTGEVAGQPVYAVIGSILEWVPSHAEVWGVGYQRATSRAADKPLTIHAVRGKLTRDLLIKQGFDCPDVYGDPALLCPRYYTPLPVEHRKLGIVPHYVDWGSATVEKYRSDPDVRTMDVRGPIERVIDGICSCDAIITSSLHGLIIADAYGIPAQWTQWSNKVIGDGFKFRDYFSVRHNVDLDKLMEACPFKGDS